MRVRTDDIIIDDMPSKSPRFMYFASECNLGMGKPGWGWTGVGMVPGIETMRPCVVRTDSEMTYPWVMAIV